jgi:DNA-binding beta-propeller fold protein YncE
VLPIPSTTLGKLSAHRALDGSGRIYVADASNNRIVRIDDMGGTNRTTFGSSGSGVNQFSFPYGLGVDAGGRIYVADESNNRIVRVSDMSGTNWTTFGTSGSGINHGCRRVPVRC